MIVHWYFLEFWTLLLQQLVAAIRTVLLIRVYHDCFTSIFYCLNKLKLFVCLFTRGPQGPRG
jgi:hypothetical protein